MKDLRRKKAILNLLGNKGKSVGQAMRDANYSEKYADNPQEFIKTKAVQKELKPILERLQEERDAALDLMKDKRQKANYGTLSKSVDDLSKLMQLLGGKPTEITSVEIDSEIRPLIEEIKNKIKKNI